MPPHLISRRALLSLAASVGLSAFARSARADVQEAAAKAKASHKIVDVVVYPDSPHGFHADYRPSYNRTDAEDGWKRAIAWFKHYGVAPKGGTQAA